MTYTPLWAKIQNLPKSTFEGSSRVIFDFIAEGVTEEEANEFGMTWENAIAIEPHWSMAHIAMSMGIFSSASAARKNGWNQPIETGYSERGGISKKNLCYFILNLQKEND